MAFVDNGFRLPEAKSIVGWIDADTVYVGTDLGPGSMTGSGYPRTVRRWRRGTPVGGPTPVFEGEATRRLRPCHARPDPRLRARPGRAGAGLLPTRALPARRRGAAPHRRAAGRRPRPAPRVAAGPQPQRRGRSAARRTRRAVSSPPTSTPGWPGERDLEVLFEPDARTSLQDHSWTRHHLVLTVLEDVATRMEVLTPQDDGWSRAPLGGVAGVLQRRRRQHGPRHQRRVLRQLQRLPGAAHPAVRRGR